MINETGLCCDCRHQENCNMHIKNKQVKVIDCQRFEMDSSDPNVMRYGCNA